MQALSGNQKHAPQGATGELGEHTLAGDQAGWYLTFALLTTLAETMFLFANISSTMTP